jgi:hypothetical protein
VAYFEQYSSPLLRAEGECVQRRTRVQPCRKDPAHLTALVAEICISNADFATDDGKTHLGGLIAYT